MPSPSIDQELEQKKTPDSDEQTGQLPPAPESTDDSQGGGDPVQTGSLSDTEQSQLLEDPAAPAGQGTTAPAGQGSTAPTGQGSTASTGQGTTAPTGQGTTASTGQGTTASTGQGTTAPAGQGTTAPTGQGSTASAGQGSTASAGQGSTAPAGQGAAASTGQGTAAPASAPSPDQYALLKKDVSTLSEDEKKERGTLLKQKYVDDWKQKKAKQMEELTEGLADDEKSKEETRKSVDVPGQTKAGKFFQGADKGKEWIDKGVDYIGMGISLGTGITDAVHEGQGKDDDDQGKKANGMVGNITNIATGGWGMASGTYGALRSGYQARQKRLKGDSRGARLSRFDTASSIFGATSGALNVAAGGAGLGKKDNASSWLGNTASILSIGGSINDMSKGIYQRHSYKNLANRKETDASRAKMASEYMQSDEKYKKMKAAYNQGDEGARSKENRMEMLKQRHAAKRSQDFIEATQAAQDHARIKSRAGGRGILSGALSTGSGLIGMAGSLAGQFGGFGGKIAGAVLGGISSLMSIGNKEIGDRISDKKGESATKQANDTRGKKYLDDKVASFLRKSEPQADHVTEDEARVIIAQQLGVADASNYSEIYKKLAERRADRILNKEEGYLEVLAALGLSEKADKATILEALGVS